MVARGYGAKFLSEGDEILISYLEHHSNIVPWQLLCDQIGTKLKVVPITDNGDINLEQYKKSITHKTKFISLSHVSNALGTVLPIKEMVAEAHANDIPVLVDGAQAVPHMKVDVQDLGAIFMSSPGIKCVVLVE